MKALILNSGMGKRMGVYTKNQPKCMTEISPSVTIISRQLKQLVDAGIKEVVMTTGAFDSVLMDYCESLDLPIRGCGAGHHYGGFDPAQGSGSEFL